MYNLRRYGKYSYGERMYSGSILQIMKYLKPILKEYKKHGYEVTFKKSKNTYRFGITNKSKFYWIEKV